MKSKKAELTEADSRTVVTRLWGKRNGEIFNKGYKISLYSVGGINLGNVLYHMVIIINNNVLSTLKLLKGNFKCSHHQKLTSSVLIICYLA